MRTRRFPKLVAATGLLVCCVATGASALDQGSTLGKSHGKRVADRPAPRNLRVLASYTPDTPDTGRSAEASPVDTSQHSSLPLMLAGLTVAGASIARRSRRTL